jgi:polyisoprenoid-binding protein YceI
MPLLPAAALALALAAAGDGSVDLQVASGSTLTFRVVHKLHEVEGLSRTVEGRARLLPGGAVQVVVRSRVDAFDSGNENRDAHLREVTEAARFPVVQLKAVGQGAAVASYPATVEVALHGELTFHGRSLPLDVPVAVRFDRPDHASAEATFAVSLEAYGVERPALLFVKVEDRVEVQARLQLEAAP